MCKRRLHAHTFVYKRRTKHAETQHCPFVKMAVIKLHLRFKRHNRKEVYRWCLEKQINELTLEDIQQKMKQITACDCPTYHVKWHDGFDKCLITSADDLRQALAALIKNNRAPDGCVHLYIEAIKQIRDASVRSPSREHRKLKEDVKQKDGAQSLKGEEERQPAAQTSCQTRSPSDECDDVTDELEGFEIAELEPEKQPESRKSNHASKERPMKNKLAKNGV
ncbi:unnamed protein product [Calicophoron daubneyi]|uniref:Uncharacterized protein n=1 Tax=Calicophoron daubneyi TaxID=300641 RepID=A0AAV2TKX1_CALDB